MNDYTESEFNEAMARLEGYQIRNIEGEDCWPDNCVVIRCCASEEDPRNYKPYTPYNDLNQLMPLYWKYTSKFIFLGAPPPEDCDDAEQNKQWVRDCLWQIAQEKQNV